MMLAKKGSLSLVIGAIFFALGVLFLLDLFGVLPDISWRLFLMYWPVLLILAGVVLFFKLRILAGILIAMLVIGGIIHFTDDWLTVPAERFIEQTVAVPGDVDNLSAELSFGAGVLRINASSNDRYTNKISTSAPQDPILSYEISSGRMTIDVARQAKRLSPRSPKEEWNVTFPKEIPLTLDLHYGAAEAVLDLRTLAVRNLDLDAGATDTTLYLSGNENDIDLHMGAGQLKIIIPSKASARFRIRSALSSVSAEGILKDGDDYITSGFDQDQFMTVTIDTAASSVLIREVSS